jgi:Holliday junction DNA helicase RuvB
MTKSFVESTLLKEDIAFQATLRPQALKDFIGQNTVKDRLEVMIQAALKRGEPLPHSLFCGPPGLGKTTLASILSKAMGTNLVVTSGPMIEKASDLAGILTNLKEGDILFIDEIHRLNRTVEEYLYPAMEDFVLDLLIDSGPNARSVQVKLNRFTLAAATTRTGLLGAPLRSRFPFSTRLDYYAPLDISKIVLRASKLLSFDISEEGSLEIARRSRGTPRIANNLLRWTRDFVQTRGDGQANQDSVKKALEMLGIDEMGLEEMDHKILDVMIRNWEGGPVGVNTIAIAVGEEPHTIEEVFEPYLIQVGFIKRTPRGREVTPQGYQHMSEKE